MSMRIAKYPPSYGMSMDVHGKLPGTVPPAPVPTLVPVAGWMVCINLVVTAQLTGKWALPSVTTEGMGDILWGYDWGPGQTHIPVEPHFMTPSVVVLTLAATTKYWLPSFSVLEPPDGGVLAAGGGGTAVAVALPGSHSILTQNCHDFACSLSFVAPTSICWQAVSTRHVGFNQGDFAAGFIGMCGDALVASIVSKFGGSLIPGKWDDQLIGGLASSLMGHGANLLQAFPDLASPLLGVGILAGLKSSPALGILLLAPIIGNGISNMAGQVGQAHGSPREAQTGLAPDELPDNEGSS